MVLDLLVCESTALVSLFLYSNHLRESRLRAGKALHKSIMSGFSA